MRTNPVVYHVSIWADMIEASRKKQCRVYTFNKPSRWNQDFIVFHLDKSMDYFKMVDHLHGYTKKHYNKMQNYSLK